MCIGRLRRPKFGVSLTKGYRSLCGLLEHLRAVNLRGGLERVSIQIHPLARVQIADGPLTRPSPLPGITYPLNIALQRTLGRALHPQSAFRNKLMEV